MNILVINGSPKGEMSVTYHHVLFLEKHFKQFHFEYLHISQLNNKLEEEYVTDLIEQMALSDAVLFCYPVYTFSVPYQLMLLIEALLDNPDRYKLKNLYAFQLSTSKHIYDTTAFEYLHLCLEDLDLQVLNGHMADKTDLLNDHGRKQLVSFFDQVHFKMEQKYLAHKKYKTFKDELFDFTYEPQSEPAKQPEDILIIYNALEYSDNLKYMIEAFENKVAYRVHLLDLSNFEIKGGCLGCLKCNYLGHCVYNDDFEKMHREKILTANVIIYASDIKNHWLHTDFKLLDDRSFYAGHNLSMKGKAVGYLLTGGLKAEQNLRIVLEAKASMFEASLLGIVTNESMDILEQIQHLADQVTYFMRHAPVPGHNFYSIGGLKIIRDLVYDNRSLLIEEHQYYKTENLYDFPKRAYVKHFLLFNYIKLLRKSKRFEKYTEKINNMMLDQYKQQIERF